MNKKKIETLNKIYEEYKLPLDLFVQTRNRIKSMGNESKQGIQDVQNFLDELPLKLKTEVSLYVYEQRYKKIRFFAHKEVSFIVWMCPLLKPELIEDP